MNAPLTLIDIKDKLGKNVSRNRAGNFIVRQGYFYRMGKSEELLAQKVKEHFPDANIIRKWDKFAPFRGGAPLSKQSHFGVEFNFKTP